VLIRTGVVAVVGVGVQGHQPAKRRKSINDPNRALSMQGTVLCQCPSYPLALRLW